MKQSVELGGVTEDTSPGTRVVLVDDRGVAHITYTRSVVWRLGSSERPGAFVVKVVGRSGGYLCSRCFALPDEALLAVEGLGV
jgi:hypothetical protein